MQSPSPPYRNPHWGGCHLLGKPSHCWAAKLNWGFLYIFIYYLWYNYTICYILYIFFMVLSLLLPLHHSKAGWSQSWLSLPTLQILASGQEEEGPKATWRVFNKMQPSCNPITRSRLGDSTGILFQVLYSALNITAESQKPFVSVEWPRCPQHYRPQAASHP